MSLRTKIDPINRDIELLLSAELSPAAQSIAFAKYAETQINDAKAVDQAAIGRVPSHTVSVDGRKGAPLETVKPNGVIVAEFELFADVLSWIEDQLETHSPVRTGLYQKSHVLMLGSQEVSVKSLAVQAGEYVFINSQPYARKIERGSSSQAPDGVYQSVAVLAAARFGNVAKIGFGYRSLMGGALGAWADTAKGSSKSRRSASSRGDWLRRQPAIIVTLGDR